MKYDDFKAWREERHPDEQDAAAIIANATSRHDAPEIMEGLYDLKAISENEYNKDSYRAVYTAIHDAAAALDRLQWEYDRLSARFDELEKQIPRKCEKCGMPIIDGLNGCTYAGNICFTCRPWNMRTPSKYAASLPYNEDDARIIENLALDMGGPLPD